MNASELLGNLVKKCFLSTTYIVIYSACSNYQPHNNVLPVAESSINYKAQDIFDYFNHLFLTESSLLNIPGVQLVPEMTDLLRGHTTNV